jgi:diguanylate cyclase (GGDEF)-like protein
MMAICYLDLDGFKPINDTMGHDAGDHVLIEVARRIENTIRGGDTVARLGGDEFVVLLLGLERGEECVTTLERLLAAISQLITIKNKSCTVSASIGVSIYPLDDEDPDTLLRHADQAMYVAKQSGKNRFHIYDPALDRRARDQHDFLKSIRHGLEDNQFELYYQPKVNLRTKELTGAEALIRWRHPERGLLSPAEFLRHIENTDLDIEIGEWVAATALAQMDRWRSTGLDIEISINISGYHLESPLFTERLQQQLAHYPDIPFNKLQIEILETVALNDIAIVRGIIESCRELGVGFALDDFGTGYSSLSYLSSLPVDVLKIDQSFVRDMLEDKGDMAIVQGIIALARAFDRQTVAEGIETEEHYQMLLDMGCELGQGYGIARPMSADELTNWRYG